MRIESLDIIAALIRLLERLVLLMSVYVSGSEALALRQARSTISRGITERRRGTRIKVDIITTGDCNRHDQLWGAGEMVCRWRDKVRQI